MVIFCYVNADQRVPAFPLKRHQQRGVPHGMLKFVGRSVHWGSTIAGPVGIVAAIGGAHVLRTLRLPPELRLLVKNLPKAA